MGTNGIERANGNGYAHKTSIERLALLLNAGPDTSIVAVLGDGIAQEFVASLRGFAAQTSPQLSDLKTCDIGITSNLFPPEYAQLPVFDPGMTVGQLREELRQRMPRL